MVEIEKPNAKNGTGGRLIHARVKVLPLGPAGPFILQGFMIEQSSEGPIPVGHMEFQADALPLLEFGLVEFRKAFAAAMKDLIDQARAAQLTTGASAAQVRRVTETKGS